MKVSHKPNQERYIFLFSDSLLYTKQTASNEFEGRMFTTLAGASITDLPDTGTFVHIQNLDPLRGTQPNPSHIINIVINNSFSVCRNSK